MPIISSGAVKCGCRGELTFEVGPGQYYTSALISQPTEATQYCFVYLYRPDGSALVVESRGMAFIYPG